jgi:hypothetical protein
MPQFTTIREFIKTAINGEHTADEVNEILDQIEQGIGLQEADRQFAQAYEDLPKHDGDDPVFLRGTLFGTQRVLDVAVPLLLKIEWNGKRTGKRTRPTCPSCRGIEKHRDPCGLKGFLVAASVDQAAEPDAAPAVEASVN